MNSFGLLIKSACVLALVLGLSACKKADQSAVSSLPLVTVLNPQSQSVTPYLDLTGTVTASQTVDLVARIPGYLQSVNFQDGAVVEKDQLLFVIEPEPYEQQLNMAKAQLLQAQSELDRQHELAKQNATSTAEVEKWQSNRDQATAQVALAELNVEYTHVLAPFSGRMGRHLVDVGNMVGVSGDTKLATLDKLIPIYVYFNLNERDALSIRQTMRKLGIEPGEVVGTVPVLVGLQDEDQFPHQGILNFVDSGASTSTGTVQLRAELNNEDLVLFPGLFARVRIPLGDPQTLPVLPGMAVGNDQQGDYVMMVNAQDVVERRSVIKGQMTPTGQAIQSGITSADRVIVRGLMSVRQGDKVRTQTDASADATAPANPVAPINQPDS